MTTAPVLDLRMDARSHGPSRGQIRGTIAALSAGRSVAWFGDQRTMRAARSKVAAAVPAAQCRTWSLEDAKRQRALVWSIGAAPSFAHITGNVEKDDDGVADHPAGLTMNEAIRAELARARATRAR